MNGFATLGEFPVLIPVLETQGDQLNAAAAAGAVVELLARQAQSAHESNDWLSLQAISAEILRIDPGCNAAWRWRGAACEALGLEAQALIAWQRAWEAEPQSGEPIEPLLRLYLHFDRAKEALSFARMQFARPGARLDSIFFLRWIQACMETRHFAEAEQAFHQLQRLHPLEDAAQFERSMLTLRLGHFPQAWQDYEKRFEARGYDGLTCFPHAHPRWQGEDLTGKRLLVHREQGYGDMMMFAAMVPELLNRAASVVLAVPPALTRLFERSFPAAQIMTARVVQGAASAVPQDWLEVVEPIDYQIPFGSLGLWLRNSRESFGNPQTYLYPRADDQRRFSHYLNTLIPRSGNLRVGLAWTAALQKEGMDAWARLNGQKKTLAPVLLEPLAALDHIDWVSLLDASANDQLVLIPGLELLDMSWAIIDFADTAALIAALDLVVTVDTAVAHLAGAMGKETWLLLRWNADWRWDAQGHNMSWYSRVRVFRQTMPDDWRDPINELIGALAERAQQSERLDNG